MRIVFADIDGVLATHRTRPAGTLDPVLVARLDRLCREAGAAVVVSSSWRSMGPLRLAEVFRRAGGQARLYGATPELPDATRGEEIVAWLARHPEAERFVIIDDDADMGALLPALVRTRSTAGLTDGDVDRARAILEGR